MTTSVDKVIPKQEWYNFIKLLDVLKDDCTDLSIQNNTICQHNDFSSSVYYVENVIPSVPDFSMTINNIRSTVPIFKIFESTDSDSITLRTDSTKRQYMICDDMSEIGFRYTLSLNNDVASTDLFQQVEEKIKLNTPVKVIQRLRDVSDNFQALNFSFREEAGKLSIYLSSIGKNRNSKLYTYGNNTDTLLSTGLVGTGDNNTTESTSTVNGSGVSSNNNNPEIWFSITPMLTFYKLISKVRKSEDGKDIEEVSTPSVDLSLGTLSSKVVLVITHTIYTGHLMRVLSRRVTQGTFLQQQ